MDAPLWGDTGGHTGAATTHLHQTTRCAITASHCTFDSPKPHGVFIPHRIAHSIAPNHAVWPYRVAVMFSIAQSWQVQRSLPWVTMQARRLPPWGLYFCQPRVADDRKLPWGKSWRGTYAIGIVLFKINFHVGKLFIHRVW